MAEKKKAMERRLTWVRSQDASGLNGARAWSAWSSWRVCCREADRRAWGLGAHRAENWWSHRKERKQSSSLRQGGRIRLHDA